MFLWISHLYTFLHPRQQSQPISSISIAHHRVTGPSFLNGTRQNPPKKKKRKKKKRKDWRSWRGVRRTSNSSRRWTAVGSRSFAWRTRRSDRRRTPNWWRWSGTSPGTAWACRWPSSSPSSWTGTHRPDKQHRWFFFLHISPRLSLGFTEFS